MKTEENACDSAMWIMLREDRPWICTVVKVVYKGTVDLLFPNPTAVDFGAVFETSK